MALGDIGIFNPSESQYKTPGAYDEALRADALKRASYLSQMDMFYEQLDETKREFEATLGFKREALAQDKWIAEQQIGLSREELALKREQGASEISLRERALEEQIRANKAEEGLKGRELSYKYSSYTSDSMDDALDFLKKYSTTTGQAASPYLSLEGRPIYSTSTSPGTGIELPTSLGMGGSSEVNYDWYA